MKANITRHRIAARLRLGMNLKGYVWAAAGDRRTLAIMKWGFATTNEIKDLRPSFIAGPY